MRRRVRIGKDSPQNLPGNFESSEALQKFNRARKYSIGFQFDTVVGLNKFPQVSFPGSARLHLGFTMFDDTGNPLNVCTINLNNENIITDASWADYTKINQFRSTDGEVTGSSFNGEYYVYPRALSGDDGVKIQYTAVTGGHFLITFYFKTDLDFLEV